MTDERQPPSTRESFNRILGLSAYAGGVCVLGIIAMGIWEDGRMPSLPSLAGMLAVLFVFFGIGYSTGRRRLK